jgi:O-antigen/teichoic acid export membrane protein
VLAIGWLLTSFENIGVVLFRKELQVHREFWFVFSKRIATFASTIPLALWLNSYWALVIGMLVGRFAGVLLSYAMHSFRPRFGLAHAREMVGFSSWLLINNFFNVVNKRVSDFVIGRSIGAGDLGIFRVATDLATLPTTELIAPINRAVFPGLAILKGDVEKLKKTFLDIVALVALVTIPAGLGIAAVAEPLVLAALGSNWVDAIDVVAVLGFYCAIFSLGTNSSVVFMAAGKVRLLTLLSAVRALALLPALVLAVPVYGLTGAVWTMTAVSAAYTPLILVAVCRLLQLRLIQIVQTLWRPMIGAAIMYVAVSEIMSSIGTPEGTLPAVIHLVGGVIAGVLIFTAAVGALWLSASRPAGPETFLLERTASWARERGLRPAAR